MSPFESTVQYGLFSSTVIVHLLGNLFIHGSVSSSISTRLAGIFNPVIASGQVLYPSANEPLAILVVPSGIFNVPVFWIGTYHKVLPSFEYTQPSTDLKSGLSSLTIISFIPLYIYNPTLSVL